MPKGKNRLATQRQEHIMAQIRTAGAVRVAELVKELGVSDMTVRRDIAELAEQGLVRKVHGGAVEMSLAIQSPDGATFQPSAAPTKRAIASAAVKLIRSGSSIAISVGATARFLADRIADDLQLRPLTVVTNSLRVAERLYTTGDRELDVVLVGGSPTPNEAFVGPLTVAMLRELRVDQLFLGVHAVSARLGIMTPSLVEGETDRALIASAGQVIVMADHSKWQTVGLSIIAPLSSVDVLITDDGLSSWEIDAARTLVGRVEVAHVPESES